MPSGILTSITVETLKSGDKRVMQVVKEILDIEEWCAGRWNGGLNISVSDVSCLYGWNMHAGNANSKPTIPLY